MMNELQKALDDLANAELSKEEFIRRAYNVILLREPDAHGIEHHMPKEKNTIIDGLLKSREFRELARQGHNLRLRAKKKQVLLIGAYGNGNIGDAIQAESMRRHLMVVRPDLEVWGYSDIPGKFEFRYDRVLPQASVYRTSVLEQFDAIIVGGGGLLSHPHAPLFDERWQSMISAPVIIFGVGASKSVSEQSKILLSKAAFVSGRDESSVEALKQFRSDVYTVPDPVLCDPFYQRRTASKGGKLFVIKHADDIELVAARKHFDPNLDTACFIEPSLDVVTSKLFPEAVPVSDSGDLLAMIDGSETVISTRFHGCILGLLRGKSVVGIREQKTRELLARYSAGTNFYTSFVNMPVEKISAGASNEHLFAEDRAKLLSSLHIALNASGV